MKKTPIARNVKQLKNIHVLQLENKNQFLIIGNGFKCFQSYDSLIAVYDGEMLLLGCDWDYSNTTRKHLYIFINNYCVIPGLDLNTSNKSKTIKKAIKDGLIKYDPLMK